MAYVKIRLRRGTAPQWEYANPVLSEGEIAIEAPDEGVGTGLVNFKIGDGVTAWQNLPYAFKAKTTAQDIATALKDIEELQENMSTVQNTLEDIENDTGSLRRVDIQEEEPNDPVLGQVWIMTDVIHGDLVVDPKSCSVSVGSEQTIRASSTLVPGADSVVWSVSGDVASVSITAKSEITSNPYVKILGMVAGTCKVTATAIYNGKGIYSVSTTVQVLQNGSMELTPSSLRLVSGNTAPISLTILDSMPYDRIAWSTSNNNVEISNASETGCTVKAINAGGQSTVYARAIYNNTTIYTASVTIMTVGMALSSTAFTMLAGSQQAVNLSNSMVKGTDYDTITWNISDSTIATVLTSSETSATVTAAKAGTTVIQAIASLSGTTVQRVQATIRVTGQLALDTTVKDINVGETFGLRLTNTLGSNDYDEIRWQTTRSDIVTIQSSTTTTAVVKAVGAGTGVISAVAYKDGVAIGIEGTASCTCTVTGAIMIPETTSTTITVGNTVDVIASCTLNSNDYNSIQWTSNNTDAVSVTYEASNPLTAHLTGVGAATATITVRALLNGQVISSDSIIITAQNAAPVGTMSINPASAIMGVDDTLTLNLNNSFQQNTQWDSIVWNSDMPSLAYITNKTNSSAIVKSLAVGPVTITATALLGGVAVDGATASAEITVSGDIKIRNKSSITTTVNIGDSIAMVADNNIYPSLYGSVDWTTSNDQLASFESHSATACTVNFTKAGTVTISVVAYDKGGDIYQTDTITFLVVGRIDITGDTGSLMNLNESRTINLNNTLEDGTWTRVDWEVSDTSIATLSNSSNTGVTVTGIAPGTFNLTATAKNNDIVVNTSTVNLTVQGSLRINAPADPSVGEGGGRLEVSASNSLVYGTYDHINWSSSNDNIFTVESDEFNDTTVTVVGNNPGTATLTVEAVDSNNSTLYSDTLEITVENVSILSLAESSIDLDAGDTHNVAVNLSRFAENGYETVTVTSSDDAIATGAISGTLATNDCAVEVTAVAEGSATLTVSSSNGTDTLTDELDVYVGAVTSELTLDNDNFELEEGEDGVAVAEISHAATNNFTIITATSNDTGVATVTASAMEGNSATITVHAESQGSTTITVESSNGTDTLTKTINVSVLTTP